MSIQYSAFHPTIRKLLAVFISCCSLQLLAAEAYVEWKSVDFAISKPLTNVTGDARRGRALVIASDKGSCLACHVMPIAEESFHGNLGPDLTHIASRLTAAEIRLRLVDEKQINPLSIMPGYYRDPNQFNLVADEYAGKTLLSAQEIEDVLAYLVTLK